MSYVLEDFNPLDKRRGIIDEDVPWAPVAWVDYDDVDRAEADRIAAAVVNGLNNQDAPTEIFREGYEAAIEDMQNGTIPMWVVGLLDEVEFMGQEPERHGIYVRGPFTEIDVARAYARTMSTDPDEAVIVPVKAQ